MTDSAFVLPGRIIEEASHLLAEVVPPEAQTHLLNAQRELLLAVAITIEHNASRRVSTPRATKSTASRKKASGRRPSRVPIE